MMVVDGGDGGGGCDGDAVVMGGMAWRGMEVIVINKLVNL